MRQPGGSGRRRIGTPHRLTVGGAIRRSLPLLLALPVIASIVAVAPLASGGHPHRNPVYEVAAVREGLAREAGPWAGRTILVRGEVVPCLAIPTEGEWPCAALAPDAWQPPSTTPWRPAIDPLPLVRAAPNPLVAFLRRVPLLDDLVPAPPALRWGAVATYRVLLRASANSICVTGPCFEAVLLDAAP